MLLWLLMSTAAMDLPLTDQAEVRLVNGPSPCAGRVEVFYENQWGSVCDDNWDSRNGQVICRQLGCGAILSTPGNANFGHGSGPIWLDNVNCNGSEYQLSQCPGSPWGQNNCAGHSEDAGAVCSEKLAKPSISASAQAGDSQDLLCKLPKLYTNTIVYFYKEPRKQVAEKNLSHQDHTAIYPANESGWYTCLYEVQASRTKQIFQSLHSERVLISTGSTVPPIGNESSVTIAAVAAGVLAAVALLVAGLVFYYMRRNGNTRPPKIDTQTKKENEYEVPKHPGQPAKAPDVSKANSMTDNLSIETGNQHYSNTMIALWDSPDSESIQVPTFQSQSRRKNRKEAKEDERYNQYLKTSGDTATSDGSIYEDPESLVKETEIDGGQYETVIGEVEAQPDNNHYELLCHETLQDATYRTINRERSLHGGVKPVLG
uniref:Soluble scavenger receptor cysteine-rich domain-containing protein SSC5D n=1 Tax=Geotrypetes seraphini TaxID=260995 RepID=A0A6P8SG33_GEOSA|nr:uncharacterized protein LOC117368355 isoform X2 [Geotrypetes seraphini]XP_033817830.1 uncharacterized protein LOC117368355 isoform X2 [Geotrypetes seraphini]